MRRCSQFSWKTKSALLCAVVCLTACTHKDKVVISPLANPAAPGSITPNETQIATGQVLLSWLEPANDGLALRYAVRGADGWSEPRTVVARNNFDKYAEAPPWVLSLPDHSLLSVWAEKLPKGKSKWEGNYLYTSASSDDGKTWTQPVIVHSDRTNGEHSFASLAIQDSSHAAIVWLDSRDYDVRHTYRLMSAVISSSGTVSDEQTVDDDVCTCCPTGLVKTETGLVAAYRNHTKEEIRDIYTVRQESGKWQAGKAINEKDGWHINGCPVNGGALAQRQNEVAAVWYTGIEEKASLQVAFSKDGGATFPVVRTIDSSRENSQPLGRPAIALLSSGNALITWITHENGTSHLVAAQVNSQGSERQREELSQGNTDSLGYPRMQLIGKDALLSWGGAGESKKVNTALLRTR